MKVNAPYSSTSLSIPHTSHHLAGPCVLLSPIYLKVRAVAIPEWAPFFLNYKLLKKKIKDIRTQRQRDQFVCSTTDNVAANDFVNPTETQTVGRDIPAGTLAMDIGPESTAAYCAEIASAKTVVWNGPMGAFETPPFDTGTNAVARAVAAQTVAGDLLSVAGGGDTMAALVNAGSNDQFTYISTAGGTFLEWLEGKTLPGIEALQIVG